MTNNDILRSIRYALDLGDGKVAEIVRLSAPELILEKADVQAMLKKDSDEGFRACSDMVMANFLDGLVFYMRGRDDSLPPRPVAKRVTNNVVLKKLRVALALKDLDMHGIFHAAGFPMSKPELSALFRQPGHKHFRACGDQILRNFLKGLAVRLRGEPVAAPPR